MYAGMIPLSVGMLLWLESYAGALLAGVPIAVVVVRILVEERFFETNIAGLGIVFGEGPVPARPVSLVTQHARKRILGVRILEYPHLYISPSRTTRTP